VPAAGYQQRPLHFAPPSGIIPPLHPFSATSGGVRELHNATRWRPSPRPLFFLPTDAVGFQRMIGDCLKSGEILDGYGDDRGGVESRPPGFAGTAGRVARAHRVPAPLARPRRGVDRLPPALIAAASLGVPRGAIKKGGDRLPAAAAAKRLQRSLSSSVPDRNRPAWAILVRWFPGCPPEKPIFALRQAAVEI